MDPIRNDSPVEDNGELPVVGVHRGGEILADTVGSPKDQADEDGLQRGDQNPRNIMNQPANGSQQLRLDFRVDNHGEL